MSTVIGLPLRTEKRVFSGVKWDIGYADHIRGAILGVMNELASPVIKHYRSDFYWDALWLQKEVNGPTEFYYSFDDCGTLIGDYDWVRNRDHVYKIELTEKNDTWKVIATLLEKS